MIGLSAQTFDLNGAVYLHEHDIELRSSSMNDISRRASRTPTIDGEASLYDAGYTDSDRTIKISIRRTSDSIETIKRLVQFYSLITVTTESGAFSANPNSLKETQRDWTLTLFVMAAI